MVIEHAPVDVAVVHQALVDGGHVGGLAAARTLEPSSPLTASASSDTWMKALRAPVRGCESSRAVAPDGAGPRDDQHVVSKSAKAAAEARGDCSSIVLRHHAFALVLGTLQGCTMAGLSSERSSAPAAAWSCRWC